MDILSVLRSLRSHRADLSGPGLWSQGGFPSLGCVPGFETVPLHSTGKHELQECLGDPISLTHKIKIYKFPF